MHDTDRERWDSLVAQTQVWLRARDANRLDDLAAQLVELDPLNEYGYRMKAEAELARGRHAEALAGFEQALGYEPQDDFILYRMAVTERLRKRYVEAEGYIDRAIRLDPVYADYWVEKAEIVYWAGDDEGVRDALDHAFDLDPEHADGLHLLARLEDRQAAVPSPDVIGRYHDALRVEPDNAYTHYNLSTAHLSRREYDKAYEHVVEALRLNPTDGDFRKTLYEILRRRSAVYRALALPGQWLRRLGHFYASIPFWLWIVLAVVKVGWLMVAFGIGACLLWGLFVWPVQKAYQWFTLGDIRAHVNEVGRGGGGPLGFHHWPFAVRMGLFLLLTAGFWFGLWQFARTEAGTMTIVWLLLLAILAYFVLGGWALISDGFAWFRRRRRRRALSPEES